MTHHSDFARGFVGLLGNARAIGHAVHITSDEVLTWDQIYRAIGRAAGAEPDIVHVPSEFIAAFDPEARAALLGDKAHSAVFDNSKIRGLVPGFLCTVPFSEGVRRSVEWFDADPSRRTVDAGFNARTDSIIRAYESAQAAGRGARPLQRSRR
jgi:nucleoside-diphosphate-sugar epimerase